MEDGTYAWGHAYQLDQGRTIRDHIPRQYKLARFGSNTESRTGQNNLTVGPNN